MLYVAWSLCFLVIVGCTGVTVYYGIWYCSVLLFPYYLFTSILEFSTMIRDVNIFTNILFWEQFAESFSGKFHDFW